MSDNDHPSPQPQGAAPRRIARPTLPQTGTVILADCSGSMSDRDDGPDGPRRIDRLAKVLDYVLHTVRLQTLICFADTPTEVVLVGAVALPEPAGGTALDLALEHVGRIRPTPARIIVISDGAPNDSISALRAAARLAPIPIDARYVGPEGAFGLLDFMRKLAASGGPGGQYGHLDLASPLLAGHELVRRIAGS